MSTPKEISYTEAIGELEKILEKLNDDTLDVDRLGEQVARGAELIGLCREKLRRAEERVADVLENETKM